MSYYQQSIVGFHNPHIHKGLSTDEFLKLYVESLKKKRFSKKGISKMKLAEFIEKNWEDQKKFVSRLFYDTLQ